MKFHRVGVRVALIAGLAIAIGPTSAFAQNSPGQAIIALENAWGKASIARDGAAVARMLSDDFTFVAPDGSISTKAQLVAAINGDTVQYVSGVNTEMIPRVHDNTIVITGLWTKGVKTLSGPVWSRYRWTDTWVKRSDGNWRCIAGQSVKLAK